MDNTMITIRVAGLGYNLILNISSSATVNYIKTEVEQRTYLPVGYQRLIARGKKLDDGDATLESLGIKDRTSFILLHNEEYAKDRDGITSIRALMKEIDDLTKDVKSKKPEVVQELITRICCKLDGIDTHGSENLRTMRKRAIMKAESIDNNDNSNSTGAANEE